ncbi:hypothetical protein NXW71_13445 [Parabacteroides merdae]|nr:hypothetical protein [Parabacteroides merdae]
MGTRRYGTRRGRLERSYPNVERPEEGIRSNVFIPGEANSLNVELDKALRLADFIEIGALMAHDALDRAESCGGHFRTEHQTEEGEAMRHDDKFMYVSCWEYQGEDKDPVMLKEDLNYQFVVPQTRNYKK